MYGPFSESRYFGARRYGCMGKSPLSFRLKLLLQFRLGRKSLRYKGGHSALARCYKVARFEQAKWYRENFRLCSQYLLVVKTFLFYNKMTDGAGMRLNGSDIKAECLL